MDFSNSDQELRALCVDSAVSMYVSVNRVLQDGIHTPWIPQADCALIIDWADSLVKYITNGK